jgi:hypothetical protein
MKPGCGAYLLPVRLPHSDIEGCRLACALTLRGIPIGVWSEATTFDEYVQGSQEAPLGESPNKLPFPDPQTKLLVLGLGEAIVTTCGQARAFLVPPASGRLANFDQFYQIEESEEAVQESRKAGLLRERPSLVSAGRSLRHPLSWNITGASCAWSVPD